MFQQLGCSSWWQNVGTLLYNVGNWARNLKVSNHYLGWTTGDHRQPRYGTNALPIIAAEVYFWIDNSTGTVLAGFAIPGTILHAQMTPPSEGFKASFDKQVNDMSCGALLGSEILGDTFRVWGTNQEPPQCKTHYSQSYMLAYTILVSTTVVATFSLLYQLCDSYVL